MKCTEEIEIPLREGVTFEKNKLHIEMTLTAAGAAVADRQEPFEKRETLSYDQSDDDKDVKGSVHAAKSIVDELCAQQSRVKPDVSELYLKLKSRQLQFFFMAFCPTSSQSLLF